ncbi:MAG: 23S rRNA (adenine(2030)-N(6))-methyltransferase RlmJ [Gammaproteobacteria bacterium]|nr:23S rRNA (adenine(2030)-N(6))-methyltransferase RlmJ [Gammaproteobacteria bacterium]
MNYEHAYHAGSHADVFKHAVLVMLFDFLTQKDKPLSYIDFYAGSGEYNLYEKTSQEFQSGIAKLKNQNLSDPHLKKYFELAQDFHHYPGSPKIAKKLLRPADEIILVEKSDPVYQQLKRNFPHDKQVHIHNMDAEVALRGLLPPKIKRGLVLIDPAYESSDEFQKLPYFIKNGMERFATATYMIWYPVKSRTIVKSFHEKLDQLLGDETEKLILECCPYPDDVPIRLNGSGLVIINPPWKFEAAAKNLIKELITFLRG